MKQLIFVFLLFVTFGCSESNEDNATNEMDALLSKLKSASYVNEPKEKLPEWLVVKINYYETRPISVQIYKGEWNKKIIYFIVDPSSSCLCDFYDKDGKRIENNQLSDLRAKSKNWILIYTYGNIVLT